MSRYLGNREPSGRRWGVSFLAAPLLFGLFFAFPPLAGADADSFAKAMKAFKEAIEFKKAGKNWNAAQSFATAVRLDRGILKEDDQGLIALLRNGYQSQLDRNPKDPAAMEGLGFVATVCDGDSRKGIEYYSQALSAASDEGSKKRLQSFIDTLKAELAAKKAVDDGPAPIPPGYGPNKPADPAPPPDDAANAELIAQAEEKLAGMNQAKEQAESKVSQIEEEIKRLEEEIDQNHRRYLTSNDRRYKRKEEAAEKSLDEKKKDLEKAKKEVEKIATEIDQFTKPNPKKAGQEVQATEWAK